MQAIEKQPSGRRTRAYRLNAPAVASQIADGEAILIHFDAGHYYSLNPTATEIFRLAVEEGKCATEIVGELVHRYDVGPGDLETKVDEFLEQLSAEELIVIDAPSRIFGTAASRETTLPANLAAWAPALLTKYSDLEDLLRLDPIHDVDDAGWPVTKPEI